MYFLGCKRHSGFITATQTPSANGVFYGHSQKSTESGQCFGLIRGDRVPQKGGGVGVAAARDAPARRQRHHIGRGLLRKRRLLSMTPTTLALFSGRRLRSANSRPIELHPTTRKSSGWLTAIDWDKNKEAKGVTTMTMPIGPAGRMRNDLPTLCPVWPTLTMRKRKAQANRFPMR